MRLSDCRQQTTINHTLSKKFQVKRIDKQPLRDCFRPRQAIHLKPLTRLSVISPIVAPLAPIAVEGYQLDQPTICIT